MQHRSVREFEIGAISAGAHFAPSGDASPILALGITQIIAWGTTLYALGVLGKPIAADTGWSQSLVFGGLTVGLLVSSVVSPLVGRLVDRRGGRSVMSVGSVLVAVGLLLLSLVARPLRLSGRVGLPRPRHAHDASTTRPSPRWCR